MALGKLPDDDGFSDGAIFAEINITPLTDIFLVLLIIFMVTSTAMVEAASSSGMKVNLPKGSQREIQPGEMSMRIKILRNGQILAGDKEAPVKLHELPKLFQSTFAKDPQTQIIIEADEGVTHGTVVNVMNMANNVGLKRLAIGTKATAQ